MIKRDVLIIGAGLGGLATAIALRKDGHNVRVLEEVTEFKEVYVYRDNSKFRNLRRMLGRRRHSSTSQ